MSTSEFVDTLEPTSAHPRYEEYEESGVDWLDEIPSHWNVVRADAFLKKKGESIDSKELNGRRVFHYSIPVIDETGDGQVEDGSEIGSSKLRLSGGELLVSKLNPRKSRVLLSDSKEKLSVCSSEFVVMEPDGCNPRFAKYLYSAEHVRQYLDSMVQSATRSHQRANPDDITKMKAGWPPIAEQRAIASYLDRKTERIDALIEKKEQLIDLLEEKRTALISRVVTRGLVGDVEMQDSGVEWLGEISSNWEVVRLKYLAEVQSGIAKGKRYDEEVETTELPYLRVANVQDGFLNLDEISTIEVATEEVDRYLLQSGDVLMTEGGDYDKLGRGTVWNGEIDPCLHQNHIFAVRPQSVESEWIALITQARYAKHFFIVQSVQSTNLASISMSSLQDLPVVLPPEEKRCKILDYVEAQTDHIDMLKNNVEEAIELLEEHRTALISAAVTGQIDVREEGESQEVKQAGTWERMILTLELIRRMRAIRHQSLGRTLLVKMLYLIQHHVRITGMGFKYKRKNYGPYASELRYEVENALQNQGWVQVSEETDQVRYELLEKADDETVQTYFENSWGDVKEQIDEVVSYFHCFDAGRAEIVATLYAAWNDLKILDRPHDDDAIIREVRENWHPRKQEIDESRWRKALRWMKDEGLVPTGFGEPTIEGEE